MHTIKEEVEKELGEQTLEEKDSIRFDLPDEANFLSAADVVDTFAPVARCCKKEELA